MADMMATLGLGLDASQLELGLPKITRLLEAAATAATAAKTAQANYNAAAKIAAPSSNMGDIAKQFRAMQQLNAAKEAASQAEQSLALQQTRRLAAAREMMPLITANTQAQLDNVKAIYAEINATSAEIAILNNAKLAKREDAAAAAAAAAATQAATAATTASVPPAQAAAAATQALAQANMAVVPPATAAAGAINNVGTAANNTQSPVAALTQLLSKLGVAFTAGQIARAGAEVLTMAARYETLGVVLDVVGRNVGKSREEMNGLAESLQAKGISMIASREELARMAAANLNLGQAADIARVAQDAAVIAGVNSSAAFERVITAITTQQPRVLRTIGIYVNFEAAQEAAAKKMGKRVEQLTAAERIQTNMNVAIAGGAQVTGAYIRAMDTAGKQLTSTVRYMQDMKTQLGETFLPEFTAGVKLYADTLKWVGDNAAVVAPILGGVLVGGLILATAAVWSLVTAVVALTAPVWLIVTAMGAALGATAYFASTAHDARLATAALNKQLDADSRVVTAYTEKIKDMSLALLKLERQELTKKSGIDASRILVLEDRVKAAKAEADKKTLIGTDIGVVAVADPAAVLRLKEAYEALAQAMREAGITNEQLTKLTQFTAKAETEAAASAGDAAEKAAKKMADFQKTLREANDALLISAAVMEAGAAPTLAQQRALEDLNIETELAAKILDIQAKARGEDAELTKAQAAQLVLLTQREGENAAATLARTRAYADWLITVEEGTARWEKEREAAEKHAEIQAEETQRITEAMEARDKAVQGIEDTLNAKRAEIAMMQAGSAGQKKDLEYLQLRITKNKEFLDATRVGNFGIPDSAKAKELTDEFIALQRVQDALKEQAESWGSALKDVTGIARALAKAFGDVGDRISGAISAGVKLYQVFTRQIDAASRLASAVKNAEKNPSEAATAAVDASKAASKGASFATATSVIAVGFALAEAADLFGTRARARAKELREAAQAFNDALDDFVRGTKKLDGYAGQIQQALSEVSGGLDNLLKSAGMQREQGVSASTYVSQANVNKYRAESQRLGQFKEDPVAFGLSIQYRILADGLQEMVDALAERVRALTPKLVGEINAYYNSAFGNDSQNQLDAAKAQWIQFTQDLVASLNAGGLTVDEYNAQITKLNAAYTENIRKINEEIEAKKRQEQQRVDRSVFDTNNATRAFTDPRGAGLAALDENAARRYNDAATAAEKAAVALFNVAERADYLAQQLEADTRTTESLTARIMGTYDTRGAEDLTRGASQRQEMADAIRSGMSESNIALLRFTQFAENSAVQMQRAIEDGTAEINKMAKAITDGIDRQIEQAQAIAKLEIAMLDAAIKAEQTSAKAIAKGFSQQIDDEKARTKAMVDAIDEQVKAAKSALDIANEQVKTLEVLVNTNAEIVTALKEFSDSLKLGEYSTLSPEAKLGEARAQFEALTLAAQGGDTEAAKKLPEAATALLDASRGFNASNEGFVADYNRVQSVIAAISGQYGVDLPVQQEQLIAAQKTVERLTDTIEMLGKQKEAIQDASSRQIDKLNEMKDQAAEDSQKILDSLNERKDKISADTQAIVDRLNEQKKAVEQSAADQIATLIANETQAHQQRLEANAYWKTFLTHIGAGTSIEEVGGGGIDDIDYGRTVKPKSVAAAQLTELKEMNTNLTDRMSTMVATLEQLVNVAVAASDDEVDATRDVSRGVTQLIAETRNAAQAAAARTTRVTR